MLQQERGEELRLPLLLTGKGRSRQDTAHGVGVQVREQEPDEIRAAETRPVPTRDMRKLVHDDVPLVRRGGVAFRLRRLAAHPRDWAERAHVAVWVFGALGMAVQLAPVYATIDRLSGIPNLALLVCATLIFTSGWMLRRSVLPGRRERRPPLPRG